MLCIYSRRDRREKGRLYATVSHSEVSCLTASDETSGLPQWRMTRQREYRQGRATISRAHENVQSRGWSPHRSLISKAITWGREQKHRDCSDGAWRNFRRVGSVMTFSPMRAFRNACAPDGLDQEASVEQNISSGVGDAKKSNLAQLEGGGKAAHGPEARVGAKTQVKAREEGTTGGANKGDRARACFPVS